MKLQFDKPISKELAIATKNNIIIFNYNQGRTSGLQFLITVFFAIKLNISQSYS